MSFDNNTTRTTGNPQDFHQPVEGNLTSYTGQPPNDIDSLGTTSVSGNTTVGHPPASAAEGFSNPGQSYAEGMRSAQQQNTRPEDWDASRPGAEGGFNPSQRETGDWQQGQDQGRTQEGVSVTDRIMGNAEKVAGHATFNAGLREKGEERKTGQL
ncbi:hypothetical protein OE88DRAFT_1657554 [Heliocybe sulcata]|uniref:Uncharacterized protein n=1 Tax=Heliocybe sulcata TaxID=5364 RepID=A0A5C3N3Z0_9AGAM|nr:hypothetical protein OE88DRAFT_1657554 [Heliocybe sulcata]